VTRPERFIELLFETNDGRLAQLYDVIGQLDPPRRAFALGLAMPSPTPRVERFKLLATAGIGVYHEWHLKTLPFGRASYDLAMTLARVEVDDHGAPAIPATRGFWTRALTGRDSAVDEDQPIDALWLTDAIGSADLRQRGDRLDQFAFGQRFLRTAPVATDAERADALFTVRNFTRYRMLLLTLERMGIHRPA